MTPYLNARTPGNMLLGYGAASINILKALHNLDVQISWFNIGQPQLTTNDYPLLQKWINNQNTFSPDAPSLTIWHENQLAERIGRGKNYALSFFELDTLNQRRRTHLNSVDHIISPSTWAKKVMENNNITVPITVIPMGVDIEIFRPTSTPTDKFIFLVCGKWEIRKGHDILPTIFSQAFPIEDYELWMMTDNIFLSPEEAQEWHNYYRQYLGDKVKFVHQVLTDGEFANIINKTSCLVSFSRTEGFDLPVLQAMACGKQILTTNYSAHTEYCTTNNTKLIDISELEPAFDGRWFGKDAQNEGNWAKLDRAQEEQGIQYLREIYNQGPTINTEGLKTAQNLTWNNCAQKIKNLIYGNNT